MENWGFKQQNIVVCWDIVGTFERPLGGLKVLGVGQIRRGNSFFFVIYGQKW